MMASTHRTSLIPSFPTPYFRLSYTVPHFSRTSPLPRFHSYALCLLESLARIVDHFSPTTRVRQLRTEGHGEVCAPLWVLKVSGGSKTRLTPLSLNLAQRLRLHSPSIHPCLGNFWVFVPFSSTIRLHRGEPSPPTELVRQRGICPPRWFRGRRGSYIVPLSRAGPSNCCKVQPGILGHKREGQIQRYRFGRSQSLIAMDSFTRMKLPSEQSLAFL